MPCKRNRDYTCARARDNDGDNGGTRKSGVRRRKKICSVERNTRRDRTVINVILLLLSRVPVWRVYRVAGDKLRVGRYYFSYGRRGHGHTNSRESGSARVCLRSSDVVRTARARAPITIPTTVRRETTEVADTSPVRGKRVTILSSFTLLKYK